MLLDHDQAGADENHLARDQHDRIKNSLADSATGNLVAGGPASLVGTAREAIDPNHPQPAALRWRDASGGTRR